MRVLTETQKEFLLKNFFTNENYAGWKNIAIKLLTTGKCIVPGTKCIWHGGVGNFIKTTEAEDADGCLLYIFDLEMFLSSQWFLQVLQQYSLQLFEKAQEIAKEQDDLNSLMFDF